jgi:MSHA pilin protein MshA
MLRNEKGFTLIEIIAVLVILGILAAVAIPRYISMMEESRNSAAQAAIGEVKARASNYYASQMLRNGGVTTLAAVAASVTATPDVGADFVATSAIASGSTGLDITVTTVKGHALTTAQTGTWVLPTSD